MAYWLIKTEPGSWSWDDQVRKGVEGWDGDRNHQAAKNRDIHHYNPIRFG